MCFSKVIVAFIALFVPAAGYANDGKVNNVGDEGNAWSGSLNEDNANNAWNFNFNSDEANADNNNNRYYGFSVRAVRGGTALYFDYILTKTFIYRNMFRLTKQQLLEDLHTSFKIAARHKNNKPYVVHFRKHLEENLSELCETLWDRSFQPQQSVCFIVNHPKKREVFAANFRDRIVHHLYFMYTHRIFERTFVHDTYSCIKKRGTHFGVDRLRYHIRSESLNYTRPCYILKMDIKGYFMSIDRELVANIAKDSLHKMMNHLSDIEIDGKKVLWNDVVDIEFIDYLTDTIALLDPTTNCRVRSDISEWMGLPKSKSLFRCAENP